MPRLGAMGLPDSLQANGPAISGSGIGKGRERTMAGKFFSQLKCRECGRTYPAKAVHVCEFDFGPLEADYDYQAIGGALNRKVIESRPKSMWRYRELLPLEGNPRWGPRSASRRW